MRCASTVWRTIGCLLVDAPTRLTDEHYGIHVVTRARMFGVFIVSLLVGVLQSSGLAHHSDSAQSGQPATSGRIIATVTTLEGTLYMSGVQVELRTSSDSTILAKTATDGAGRVTFPEVPPGSYLIRVDRPGFVVTSSPAFEVKAGEAAQVLLDIQLTFIVPEVVVRAETPSPTDSVQPVSMSDMLAGSVFELAPLEGDDFQSLLLLLPGVVRGPDGRLRIKGGQPSQSALQISSASLNDPSSGDFDLDLPSQSVESVEVLSNPFAAEYRSLLRQHYAGPNKTGNQRVGNQARKSRPAVPEGPQRDTRLRAALLGARTSQAQPGVPRAGFSIPLCRDAGEKPGRRASDHAEELRLFHPGRYRNLGAPHAWRRASFISARGQEGHDEHIPAA